MAPTLTIDGYDISQLVLWGDRSHDFGQPLSPQFGGNTAFNDGQPFVRMAGVNREWQVPLLLTGSTDTINALVQTINSHLFQGAQVAFKPQGATNTTYFDLERGLLDPHWDLYEDTAGVLRVGLHLSTRPYGNTGTTRLVASVLGAAAVLQLPATGIAGDIPAAAQLRIGSGSYGTPSTAFRAYAIAAHPSYTALWAAASILKAAGGTATAVGGSGAVASQYWSLSIVPTGVVTPIVVAPPIEPLTGRQRVLMVARSAVTPATGLALQFTQNNGYTSPTAQFKLTSASQWQVLDMGEMQFSRIGSALPASDLSGLSLQITGASGASAIASPGVHVNAFVFLPLDTNAAIGVRVASTAAQLPDTAQSVWSFETWPARVAWRSLVGGALNGASVSRDITGDVRGDLPYIPPTGTSTPSGPRQIIAMMGDPNDFHGNDAVSLSLSVTERFTFLR